MLGLQVHAIILKFGCDISALPKLTQNCLLNLPSLKRKLRQERKSIVPMSEKQYKVEAEKRKPGAVCWHPVLLTITQTFWTHPTKCGRQKCWRRETSSSLTFQQALASCSLIQEARGSDSQKYPKKCFHLQGHLTDEEMAQTNKYVHLAKLSYTG